MAAGKIRVLLDLVKESKEKVYGWSRLAAPAKVNLMLSVHGRRPDGFHELTSLVAPLEFGDELELRLNGSGEDHLVGGGEDVPLDASNLVLKAAKIFRQATGLSECFDFRLHKRIPVGAGLGGGSSDAVAALKGMNALLGAGLDGDKLREWASVLGSDCPFFVDGVPALMRGRGESVEPVAPSLSSRLAGQRLVLFRPDFGVDTAWAYARLAASPQDYEPEDLAHERLHALHHGGRLEEVLKNGFEASVGRKFLAIPCLLERLRRRGYACMMSGSGSACFALVDNEGQAAEISAICRKCWGGGIFWVETSLIEGKME